MIVGRVLSEYLDSLDWDLPASTVICSVVNRIRVIFPGLTWEEAEDWAIDLVMLRFSNGM